MNSQSMTTLLNLAEQGGQLSTTAIITSIVGGVLTAAFIHTAKKVDDAIQNYASCSAISFFYHRVWNEVGPMHLRRWDRNQQTEARPSLAIDTFSLSRESALMGDDCPICLHKFQSGSTICKVHSCGHSFHDLCLTTWADASFRRCPTASPNCPCCRIDLSNQPEKKKISEAP